MGSARGGRGGGSMASDEDDGAYGRLLKAYNDDAFDSDKFGKIRAQAAFALILRLWAGEATEAGAAAEGRPQDPPPGGNIIDKYKQFHKRITGHDYAPEKNRLNRQDITRIVKASVRLGLLKLSPKINTALRDKIVAGFTRVHHGRFKEGCDRFNVHVVNTVDPRDIAKVGMEELIKLLEEFRKKEVVDLKGTSGDDIEARVGWAGGRTLGFAAEELAAMLSERLPSGSGRDPIPKKILFQGLVGAMVGNQPQVDPNAYFMHFARAASGSRLGETTVRFRGMPAPGIIKGSDRDRLETFDAIKEAREDSKHLDIIICSCGHWKRWSERHGSKPAKARASEERCYSIRDYMEDSCTSSRASRVTSALKDLWDKTEERLKYLNVTGDLAWCLVNEQGPVLDHEDDVCVATALQIKDMTWITRERRGPEGRQNPGQMLLLVSPCVGCKDDKGELLYHILKMDGSPVTDLVTDYRSATTLCNKAGW